MKTLKINLIKVSLLILSVFSLLSCSKDDDKPNVIEPSTNNPPGNTTLSSDYVLTSEFRGPQNAIILWKDGISTEITNGTNDEIAKDMKVVGTDVYILAQVNFTSSSSVIRVYKNGTALNNYDIPGSTSKPAALDVVGTDVYVAGSYYNASTNTENLAYWKNGTKIDLKTNVFFSVLNDIEISENSVYVLGTIRNANSNSEITYWKDGVSTAITNPAGTNTEARSFDVVGTTCHITGLLYTSANLSKKKPYYYNNTTGTALVTTPDANTEEYGQDIAVANGNVYIVGEIFSVKYNATQWKDGVQTVIQPSTTFANFAQRVQVSGSTIYIGGREKFANNEEKAKVWKNGVGTFYLTANATSSALAAMQFKP